MAKVRLLMVAEVEVEADVEAKDTAIADAEERLDAFREAVRPESEHGISLARFRLSDDADLLECVEGGENFRVTR